MTTQFKRARFSRAAPTATRRLLAVNPEGTKRTLAKLYPCLPPPDARPQAAAPEDNSYPKDWLNQPPRGSIAFEDPGLQAQAAQQQPSRVTVVND